MVNKNFMEQDCRQRLREVLLKKHRHQCKTKSSKKSKASMSSFGSFAKKASSAGLSEMLKRSDSTPKASTAQEPQRLEIINETDDNRGEFQHLPSAVDLVQKESDAKVEMERENSDTCLEVYYKFICIHESLIEGTTLYRFIQIVKKCRSWQSRFLYYTKRKNLMNS